jgi:L-histidine N-alpha-methyltransferase
MSRAAAAGALTLHRIDAAELAEVRAGLGGKPKTLSPKFFYDTRGSELFEAITRLPEYYPTRAERAVLTRWMPELIAALRPRALVELGAGAAEKTRVILDAMRTHVADPVYVPLDVSADFLGDTAARLRREYPRLTVVPLVADLELPFTFPRVPGPALVAFLGSTIGNFNFPDAIRLLRRVRHQLRPADRFLLGMDLRKDVATLEAAYNDAEGVTAEFNRNALRVLNARLAADFEPDAFRHLAFYNRVAHRIEMHLVAEREMTVTIPGIEPVLFEAGESVRTEISCKYDRATAVAMLGDAGLTLADWRTDPEGRFALALAAPLP